MKKNYFAVLLFITNFIFAQNFTDTKGELQISSSGTAVYNLPIALPPSIQNVAPVINLVYSSGLRGGIAGQGWNINSISTISRISTRRDIDGFVDGVDFDADDKLSLDGQRLLLKSGTYWANASTYETEFKSNFKIELKIENNGNSTFFIVTAPDGSRTWYGSKGSGTYQNSTSATSWYIVSYEDPNGNEIKYNYTNVIYNSTNQLYIASIEFSGNTMAGISFQNKIEFNYKNSSRVERDYTKGLPVHATKTLDYIRVLTNNSLFRKYQLLHSVDSMGYNRVTSIQEINGQGDLSNPILFQYNSTPETLTRIEKTYTNNLAFDKIDLAGDFDGDGRLDFVSKKEIYTNLFNGTSGSSPIILPNIPFDGEISKLKFAATLLKNNKLNQFQSIVVPFETLDNIEFKAYDIVSNSILTSSVKTVPFDNAVYCDKSFSGIGGNAPVNCPSRNKRVANTYLEGDFNGDGISDVVVLTIDEKNTYGPVPGSGNNFVWTYSKSTRIAKARFVDLNPNVTSTDNSIGNFDLGSKVYLLNGKRFVADMNGDGKSDIIIFQPNGSYSILGITQNSVGPWAPWGEFETLGSGIVDKYSDTKQILFGDYNGDGKTDIMIASEEGANKVEWNIYYSNQKGQFEEFFTKETLDIVEYRPDTGSDYKTQRHYSNYYAIDINKDGKSDLVRVWRKYFKDDWSINNHDTQWQVTGFTNNIGKVGASGFPLTYNSGVFTSNSPDIPIPITSNYKYNGANTELIVVRGHYNIIEYYQFNKDYEQDNRMISVTESSSNIKQTIDYLPMIASNGNLGNAASDFYSSSNSVNYPNIELIKNPSSYLVSRLTATINGVSKFQDYKYRGYVSNYNYGTVGFLRTARSSWYLNSSNPKIWTIQNNDANLRGANTITWTNTDASSAFATTPNNLLSTKTNVFSTYINPTTKVYNVLLDKQTTVDALTAIKSEDVYTYDGIVSSSTYYGLETQRVSKNYLGATLQATTSATTFYSNNPLGVGSNYYIGRPNQISSSTVYSGDTRTSEEKLYYTGSNLTKTEKKGHNTYAIVENMTYDAVGNLLTKSVSAPNAPVVPTARTITDVYDISKRFVIKKTDHQGYSTDFNYNSSGQVTYSKNYLGIISNYTYDNWGKLLNQTLVNTSATAISTNTAYTKLSTGGYIVTTTDNIGTKSVAEFDVLGRQVVGSVQGFAANSLMSTKTIYDDLGRKLKESEPYFFSPSLWTTYEYDYLERPATIISPTGKVQTLSYSGVTTTSNDDGRITTVTVDALGNKVQTTDNGGTITFKYFANGALKESDFEGNKITMTIDGWGNKTSTTDPNAGTYTYAYDSFGQMISETTPKGTSSYTYDATGRITQKKVIGDFTNNTLNYVYNLTTNLVTSTTFINTQESLTTTNSFVYDSLKRLISKTESNSSVNFVTQLTYDTYGRIDTETKTATVSGKSSTKTVKNTYQNGYHWQILDASTLQVLWQANSFNERGQLLTASLGNGTSTSNSYNSYGYLTQNKIDKTGATPVNIMTLTNQFEPKRGNLTSRTNSMFSWTENFTYDSLDRLLSFKNGQGQVVSQTYDNKGRITQNTTGTYKYTISGKVYQNNAITLSASGLSYYQSRLKQKISYTSFKSPYEIEETGIDKLNFTYNQNNSRSVMYYGGVQDDKLLRPLRKYYSGDGSIEVKENRVTGVFEFITYIGGDGYSAPLVYKSNGITAGNYLYLHRDYQGSVLAITDNSGVVVEKRLFDAWGLLLKAQNGSGTTLSGLTLLDRGYTGHEHLQSVGLINMNGRIYDPLLHRFLQPDNFVQQPENTQNYNRYAYVLNNPLKYTDPSGESVAFLAAVGVGAAIAALTYTVTALVADVPFTVGGLAKATFIGAASAAVTYGIGSAAGTISNFYVRSAVSAVAHGTFQGGMTSISGGKFWSGFAAGALSSIAASAFGAGFDHEGIDANGDMINATKVWNGAGNLANNSAGMIAFGTVAGGTGAVLTGGNFWQGAATGLVVSGLNHAMHKMGGPPTKRKEMAERLGKRYQRNENRIMAESLVAEALIEMTEPGELLTGFRENFDKTYGNQQSHDANEVYSQGIEVIKNIKDSFGGGKITDYMLFKASAAIYADIMYLHTENSGLSTSIQYLDKNSYYKYVNPSAKPEGGGFSGGGSGGRWYNLLK